MKLVPTGVPLLLILICVSGEPSGRVIVRYLPTGPVGPVGPEGCPCSFTVQPTGIPLTPVDHSTPAALLNVPVSATPDNHPAVQFVADISVARQVTFCKFEHP